MPCDVVMQTEDPTSQVPLDNKAASCCPAAVLSKALWTQPHPACIHKSDDTQSTGCFILAWLSECLTGSRVHSPGHQNFAGVNRISAPAFADDFFVKTEWDQTVSLF